jgi:peptidyl-prolyl cis-trans isomerase A (cyclophilin A)
MKENNGAAARRTMIHKITLMSILSLLAVIAHQYSNALLKHSIDDVKRLRPANSVTSGKNSNYANEHIKQPDSVVESSGLSNQMSEIQAEDKESIERLNENKEAIPYTQASDVADKKPKKEEKMKEKKKEEKKKEEKKKEGRLIEFTVGNVNGEAGKEGKFVVQTNPSWAPLGVQRFEELTASSFWDNCRFFRVVPKFIVQFGINGDPKIQKKWDSRIQDDPVSHTNEIGTVTFATAGPNTRTTQMFVNIGEKNSFLDKQGFSPIGKVIEGMTTVQNIFKGYGEQPKQNIIQNKGNEYLNASYPKLSFIIKAKFLD